MGLLTSPLEHVTARLAPTMTFGGWSLPRTFSTPDHEVRAALNEVGLFDASAWGRISVRGRDGLDLLHRMSTNDLRTIPEGRGVSTVLTTEKGRIVDAVYLLPAAAGHLLITSIGAEDEIVRWVAKFTIMEDIDLEPVTRTTAQLTLIGPRAARVLETIGRARDAVKPDIAVTGEGGLPRIHIVVSSQNAELLWEMLREAGATPIGMEAWEILRIMHGIPERPFELRSDFNPYDVGLREAISYSKGCYIGQEVIARLDTYQKVRRALVGLRSTREPVAIGSVLETAAGEESGEVTSQAPAPLDGEWLGLAVVRIDRLPAGTKSMIRGTGVEVLTEAVPMKISQPG